MKYIVNNLFDNFNNILKYESHCSKLKDGKIIFNFDHINKQTVKQDFPRCRKKRRFSQTILVIIGNQRLGKIHLVLLFI